MAGVHRGLRRIGRSEHDGEAGSTRSSAQPSGELATPRASRNNACRITSTGTPSAIEQTTAKSFAALSLCEPLRLAERRSYGLKNQRECQL